MTDRMAFSPPEPWQDGDLPSCRRLLEGLPEWFAEDAVLHHLRTLVPDRGLVCRDEEGCVAGMVSWETSEGTSGHLSVCVASIAVRRAFRGSGVGSVLLTALESRLDAGDILWLDTLSEAQGNEAYRSTRAFYERHGFRRAYDWVCPEWGPDFIVSRYEKVV